MSVCSVLLVCTPVYLSGLCLVMSQSVSAFLDSDVIFLPSSLPCTHSLTLFETWVGIPLICPLLIEKVTQKGNVVYYYCLSMVCGKHVLLCWISNVLHFSSSRNKKTEKHRTMQNNNFCFFFFFPLFNAFFQFPMANPHDLQPIHHSQHSKHSTLSPFLLLVVYYI